MVSQAVPQSARVLRVQALDLISACAVDHRSSDDGAPVDLLESDLLDSIKRACHGLKDGHDAPGDQRGADEIGGGAAEGGGNWVDVAFAIVADGFDFVGDSTRWVGSAVAGISVD